MYPSLYHPSSHLPKCSLVCLCAFKNRLQIFEKYNLWIVSGLAVSCGSPRFTTVVSESHLGKPPVCSHGHAAISYQTRRTQTNAPLVDAVS